MVKVIYLMILITAIFMQGKRKIFFNRLCSNGRNGNLNLAIYMSMRKNIGDIQRILNSMRWTRLQKYLMFLKDNSFKNDACKEFFGMVLSLCPLLFLTEFLLSLSVDNLHELLSEDDEKYIGSSEIICFLYMKGLIVLDKVQEANDFLGDFLGRYSDERNLEIIRLMIKEMLNQHVSLDERSKLFRFMISIPKQLFWYIRSRNEDLSHSDALCFLNDKMSQAAVFLNVEFHPFVIDDEEKVNIPSFVGMTFRLAQLDVSRAVDCLICHQQSGSEDSHPFRILSCCTERCSDPKDIKCVCENCLIEWGTRCNAEDPSNRFKRGTFLTCPNCRTEFPFFPQNP